MATKQLKDYLEMYQSLLIAVDIAGGCGYNDINELSKITVLDLIERLAPNGIRFCYIEPKKPKEEKEDKCPKGLFFGKDFDKCNPSGCEIVKDCIHAFYKAYEED